MAMASDQSGPDLEVAQELAQPMGHIIPAQVEFEVVGLQGVADRATGQKGCAQDGLSAGLGLRGGNLEGPCHHIGVQLGQQILPDLLNQVPRGQDDALGFLAGHQIRCTMVAFEDQAGDQAGIAGIGCRQRDLILALAMGAGQGHGKLRQLAGTVTATLLVELILDLLGKAHGGPGPGPGSPVWPFRHGWARPRPRTRRASRVWSWRMTPLLTIASGASKTRMPSDSRTSVSVRTGTALSSWYLAIRLSSIQALLVMRRSNRGHSLARHVQGWP